MKNLQGLLAFIESADAGSQAKASERLGITPAAVSKSLAALERRLGVRLLNRSTRRLALTAEGSALLDKAKAALQLLDEGLADVSKSAEIPSGLVRISVGAGFGRRYVLPALPDLLAKYPELSIEVDLENRPVDLVASGFDIGIRGGVIDDSSLIARRVCALPVALFASPAYLREAGVPSQPADLARHRCIAVRSATRTGPEWRFHSPRGAATIFRPKARLTTSDPDSLIDLALTGAGIVQAGVYAAIPYLRTGRLKLLMPKLHDAGTRQFVIHYPHRRFLAPRVRVVVDALLAHFGRLRDLQLGINELVRDHPEVVASQSSHMKKS